MLMGTLNPTHSLILDVFIIVYCAEIPIENFGQIVMQLYIEKSQLFSSVMHFIACSIATPQPAMQHCGAHMNTAPGDDRTMQIRSRLRKKADQRKASDNSNNSNSSHQTKLSARQKSSSNGLCCSKKCSIITDSSCFKTVHFYCLSF